MGRPRANCRRAVAHGHRSLFSRSGGRVDPGSGIRCSLQARRQDLEGRERKKREFPAMACHIDCVAGRAQSGRKDQIHCEVVLNCPASRVRQRAELPAAPVTKSSIAPPGSGKALGRRQGLISMEHGPAQGQQHRAQGTSKHFQAAAAGLAWHWPAERGPFWTTVVATTDRGTDLHPARRAKPCENG